MHYATHCPNPFCFPGFLRQRYLQYVREIAERGLDWKNLGPVIAAYREQLKDELAIDTRKLSTLDAFLRATAPAPESEEEASGLSVAMPASGDNQFGGQSSALTSTSCSVTTIFSDSGVGLAASSTA